MKLLTILLLLPFLIFSQKDEEIKIVDTNKLGKVTNLTGKLKTIELYSTILKEPRKITLYEPPYYSKDSTYGVVFLTDNFAPDIANYIEFLILNHKIKPIILVGIHNREPQPIDTLFKDYLYDFRMEEMLKNSVRFTSEKALKAYSDETFTNLIKDRYNRFSNFVSKEVTAFLKKNYTLNQSNTTWTIGGFSNGGAFVYGFTTDHPGIFGNSIVMSPAGFNGYNIEQAKGNYYLCAGTLEPESFMQNSLEYLPDFNKNNIFFVHKSYKEDHNSNMWITFCVESISRIYYNP